MYARWEEERIKLEKRAMETAAPSLHTTHKLDPEASWKKNNTS
jgi:hypothetical protein